jgi:hypothetical protein
VEALSTTTVPAWSTNVVAQNYQFIDETELIADQYGMSLEVAFHTVLGGSEVEESSDRSGGTETHESIGIFPNILPP